jgi:hypothetical protein
MTEYSLNESELSMSSVQYLLFVKLRVTLNKILQLLEFVQLVQRGTRVQRGTAEVKRERNRMRKIKWLKLNG